MLDVRRLRLLGELSRRGTIAEVAKAVGYTPSAVSQSLAQLEREAGVALLERDGRRVRLTTAAHRLVAPSDRVLAELDAAEAELAAEHGAVSGSPCWSASRCCSCSPQTTTPPSRSTSGRCATRPGSAACRALSSRSRSSSPAAERASRRASSTAPTTWASTRRSQGPASASACWALSHAGKRRACGTR